jgi:hypothetical protein
MGGAHIRGACYCETDKGGQIFGSMIITQWYLLVRETGTECQYAFT